jgi:hypothetical protein
MSSLPSGFQLLSCISEAMTISAVATPFSSNQSRVVARVAGMSAAVSVDPRYRSMAGSARVDKSDNMTGSRKALSTKIILLSVQGFAKFSRAFKASSRLLAAPSPVFVSILAERSSIKAIASGAPDEKENSESPPVIGRDRAKIKPIKANTRSNKVSHRFNRESLDELRLACKRKRVAAHGCDRCRSRFSRWMITGSNAKGNPNSARG